jgi:alanine racemase
VALLPAGYSDGYPHRLGNRGCVLVRGRRAPVIGAVTMDYVMVDATDVPDVAVGDVVTLWGDGLRVEELGRLIGTIPYELTCRLGRRVKRVYRQAAGRAAA